MAYFSNGYVQTVEGVIARLLHSNGTSVCSTVWAARHVSSYFIVCSWQIWLISDCLELGISTARHRVLICAAIITTLWPHVQVSVQEGAYLGPECMLCACSV